MLLVGINYPKCVFGFESHVHYFLNIVLSLSHDFTSKVVFCVNSNKHLPLTEKSKAVGRWAHLEPAVCDVNSARTWRQRIFHHHGILSFCVDRNPYHPCMVYLPTFG